MATFEKIKFSEAGTNNYPVDFGTNGIPVNVHYTGTSSSILDEVWLWVSNPNYQEANISVKLNSFLFGMFVVPGRTSILALAGHPVSGTGSSTSYIQVYDTDLILLPLYAYGFVNRITP